MVGVHAARPRGHERGGAGSHRSSAIRGDRRGDARAGRQCPTRKSSRPGTSRVKGRDMRTAADPVLERYRLQKDIEKLRELSNNPHTPRAMAMAAQRMLAAAESPAPPRHRSPPPERRSPSPARAKSPPSRLRADDPHEDPKAVSALQAEIEHHRARHGNSPSPELVRAWAREEIAAPGTLAQRAVARAELAAVMGITPRHQRVRNEGTLQVFPTRTRGR